MRSVVFISSLLITLSAFSQEIQVSYKNISECLENCIDNREVLSQSLDTNFTYSIKLGAYLNCASPGNPSATAKLKNDTLMVYIPEYEAYRDTIYITQSDSFKTMIVNEEVLEVMCSCFFHISLKISGLSTEPKYIVLW